MMISLGSTIARKSSCKVGRPSQRNATICAAVQDPLLLRVARGEEAERTPVWLMRQAGRYMADFRKFSAVSHSERDQKLPVLQWSSMGVEFDVVKGTGPVIADPIKHTDDLSRLIPLDDPASSLPFVGETLRTLRGEVDNQATVLGFIGTPWTLAAYAIEGKADRHCTKTKRNDDE
eukprot:jgi/Picre1/35746/NNA_003206.t1